MSHRPSESIDPAVGGAESRPRRFQPTGRLPSASDLEAANGSPDERIAKTGTTTVALAGRDGVVLAADTRASVGNGRFVTNRTTRKIEPIGEHAAVAFSGSVSGAQAFVRDLRARVRLYRLEHGAPIPLESLATLAGGVLRSDPGWGIGVLLAGVDPEPEDGTERAGAVYDVDPAGGVLRTDYAAGGSGMQLAYGALEGTADPEEPVDRLRRIAADAVECAAARDTASGDGLSVVTVTADGVAGGDIEPLGPGAGVDERDSTDPTDDEPSADPEVS